MHWRITLKHRNVALQFLEVNCLFDFKKNFVLYLRIMGTIEEPYRNLDENPGIE